MPNRETGLMQRVRQSWRRAGRPSAVLVGYSGGADSLALLAVLRDLARLEGITLRAAHVDHGVRAESAADADVVRVNTTTLGIPLVVERVPGDALSRHAGVGPEEAMRRERYRILARIAGEAGAVIATGHHQRDQAETVLLHIMRGAGLSGVAGMREVASLHVPWWDEVAGEPVAVWRPLLGLPYAEVRSVAEDTGLPIVEDSSNTDIEYRRNAVRHRVLPVMEEASPGVEATLARFAGLAAVDADELDGRAGEALAAVRHGADLDRRQVIALRPAIRSRVVFQWLAEGLPFGIEVSRERIEAMLAVAETPGPQRTVQIAGGWSVEVSRQWLRLQYADRSEGHRQ